MKRCRLISLFAALVVGIGILAPQTSAIAADDPCSITDINGKCPATTADDVTDSVVTTGVQFPGVDADSALGKATAAHSGCNGCEWILSPACVANGPTDEQMCQGATESCVGADDVY